MTLLLLAGTGEARALADRIAGAGVAAVASIAGVGRDSPLALPTRVGGFGGRAGFEQYLAEAGITAILDATHPFAARISARAAAVASALGLPYLQLLRPEWPPAPEDDWVRITGPEAVAEAIPAEATVFLATGRASLPRFTGLANRRVYCRVLSEPGAAFPFPEGGYVAGMPSADVDEEAALFRRLGIDWLVVKNAGGPVGRAKLDATRALGIRVAMIARPPQPEAPRVDGVSAAMAWVRAL